MPIGVELTGNNGDHRVHRAQIHDDDTVSGLVVFTKEFVKTDTQIAPFLNDEFGEALNQDAAFGGTPIRVHDGIDTTLWTGSQIVGGKVTFNSSDRADVGSNSIKIDNPDQVGDALRAATGSDKTTVIEVKVGRAHV